MMMAAPAAGGAGHPLAAPGAARAAAVPPEEAGWLEIKAPIVGTFYRSPAPDADPFVKLGQTVDEETVVCIVEAMKVMNEIKAEVRGVIRKILVENATPIEFGQVLFKVEPL
jgi:acetyl-CoA carboxylase biotin carboxyl carrier protein